MRAKRQSACIKSVELEHRRLVRGTALFFLSEAAAVIGAAKHTGAASTQRLLGQAQLMPNHKTSGRHTAYTPFSITLEAKFKQSAVLAATLTRQV